jgi:hypothetical protein
MKLNEKVSIGSGFKKSVNIIADNKSNDILDNYILSLSSEYVLNSVVGHIKKSGHSSFTWTGPYGTGKSSLALFLLSLFQPDHESYSKSLNKISKDRQSLLSFFSSDKKRKIFSLIGSTESPLFELAKVFNIQPNISELLEKIDFLSKSGDGIILLIDEMGKFLEQVGNGKDSDIYLFQQIAEIANRSNGKIIFIGILHQSFAEYSRNLSKSYRDEWIKIQGRFVDLPINAANEEQIDLISRAIESDLKPKNIPDNVKLITNIISSNKPISEQSLQRSLANSWPLHPAVTSLLGPVSRKRFGQNQRSIFSFLCSAEAFGFQHFLSTNDLNSAPLYKPHNYWDYLQANFENTILASNDANIWALATEAINKTIVTLGSDIAVNLIKTIALINIFKGNSGLHASKKLLQEIYTSHSISKYLEDLKNLSVVREDKYNNSFSLFEGSDFDIDDELEEALKQITRVDFEKLNKLASFKPVVAKRHYHETGALRWMNMRLSPFSVFKENIVNLDNAFGEFVIIISDSRDECIEAQDYVETYKSNDNLQVINISNDYIELKDFSRELLALEWLKKNSLLLSGDRVARREVDNRINFISIQLNKLLELAVLRSEWHHNGISLGLLTERGLSQKCSEFADIMYNKSPKIKSEMLNRSKPSGNANAAINSLLKRMVLNSGEDALGIIGYPAEKGLFKILLEDTNIYNLDNNIWDFSIPKDDNRNLILLWEFTDNILLSHEANVSLSEVYEKWSAPPFGVKGGLNSFLISAYILSKKGNVAVYLDGTYIPEIDDLFIDYVSRGPNNISLRYIKENSNNNDILIALASRLMDEGIVSEFNLKGINSLIMAKELVRITEKINPWVLRTRTLSKKTTKLRELLKSAHDPNKLIYDDLEVLFDISVGEDNVRQFSLSLKEMIGAYPNLLEKLGQSLLDGLQIDIMTPENIKKLNKRAENIRTMSGDFRVDAFATRLSKFDSTENDIAGIASLAANKPIHDWIDLDVERALIEIAELCQKFRRAELYAHVKGKKSNRHAIALISGLSGSNDTYELEFDVLDDKKNQIDEIKEKIQRITDTYNDEEIILAAMTERSIELMNKIKSKKNKKAI